MLQEARNFEIRKQLLEFDDVMNEQRKVIYGIRQDVLTGKNIEKYLADFINDAVEKALDENLNERESPEKWNPQAMQLYLKNVFNIDFNLTLPDSPRQQRLYRETIYEAIMDALKKKIDSQKDALGEMFGEVLRIIFLQAIDHRWKGHLRSIDELREGIGLRAYGQRDVIVAYKQEAFILFEEMLEAIKNEVLTSIFRIKVSERVAAKVPSKIFVPQSYSHRELNQFETIRDREHSSAVQESPSLQQSAGPVVKQQPVRVGRKVGRNEPCPCGSGKKYKKCCGARE